MGTRVNRLFALLAVAGAIAAALLGSEFLRFVARERSDLRPCPNCRHEAFIKGQPLVDDKAQPLGFSSAAAALRYERAYAQP